MPKSGKAIPTAQVSLYLGIISLLCAISPIIGNLFRTPVFLFTTTAALVLAVAGLVFGVKGRKTEYTDKATAGLILCCLALLVVLGIVLLIGAILLFYPRI